MSANWDSNNARFSADPANTPTAAFTAAELTPANLKVDSSIPASNAVSKETETSPSTAVIEPGATLSISVIALSLLPVSAAVSWAATTIV